MKTQSARPVLRCLVVGLLLAVGWGAVDLVTGAAAHAENAGLRSQVSPAQPDDRDSMPLPSAALPDGIYLYGQSAEPDQTGKAYFVFEARQGRMLGAFYMPRSSFDCAYGSFQSQKVALTVIDSYEKTANPYEIAVERSGVVATNGNPTLSKIGLEGFYQLTKISDNDQRILQVCQANYPHILP